MLSKFLSHAYYARIKKYFFVVLIIIWATEINTHN